jgi:CheY-like chemotaxis protein
VSVPKKALWLIGDATRLEQLVANLLTNSAKYTEPGGRIEVKARRHDDTIIISVRDNGVGITAEALPDVFELFSQSNPSSERAAGGLGIGLTLVKSIAELHGGSVAAKSEGLHKGSEFTVRLPTLGVDERRRHAEVRPAPVANAYPERRLLLVDDNEDASLALSRLLEASGHTVIQAYDGPTALEVAAAYKPDAVLLDIGLPGMDGYEVARRIRQDPELAQTRLIAISGYCQEEDRRRSREAGFDHHLAKPTNLKELLALLGKSLQATEVKNEAGTDPPAPD